MKIQRRSFVMRLLEHLARIEDARGIERCLDGAHQVELRRALVAGELVALQLADSVFGADAAAMRGDEVVDDPVCARRVRHEGSGHGALGGSQVVVEVAIAKVAEGDETYAWQRGIE